MKLNAQQEKAIVLVVLGKSGREIAEACEVTPETVSRWRQMPLFIATVNRILKDSQDEVKLRLHSLTNMALNAIESILTNEESPPNMRLQAALKVLELNQAGSWVKRQIGSDDCNIVEIEQRTQEIEQQIEFEKNRLILNHKRDNLNEKVMNKVERALLWER